MSERRTVVAFLVAPLAMPLFSAGLAMLLSGTPRSTQYELLVFVIALVTFVSYVMSALVGIPTYQFLVARQMTAFRIAPLAGAFVGFVSYWLFGLGTALLRYRFETWTLALETLMFSLHAALAGAAGGIIFWLIARPDRQTLPDSPAHDEHVGPYDGR